MNSAGKQALNAALAPYLSRIENGLKELPLDDHIPLFYDPIRYFLDIPGKRIRPLLLLLTAEALGQTVENAIPAALAVELLHNFTLVHDDIMDNDDTRRGHATIHKKWDVATAILAGDGLMGLAFRSLLQTPVSDVAAMARRFTETMLVVCEGQGLDKMFETEPLVEPPRYLDMISRKTAVLLELSCELGAITADASPETISDMRRFGYALGMGFQIQDDVLDITGDSQTLGKTVGSDLQMHKQTILTIELQKHYPDTVIFNLSVADFVSLLKESGVLRKAENMYRDHFKTALEILTTLPESPAKSYLQTLSRFIQNRNW